jgi:hypothetical protein
MKFLVWLIAALVLVTGCSRKIITKVDMNKEIEDAFPARTGNVCFLNTIISPENQPYQIIGQMQSRKGAYGSSHQVFKAMADEARKIGADAVMNGEVGQKFRGLNPFRVVSPTGEGIAIRFTSRTQNFDCEKNGGVLY